MKPIKKSPLRDFLEFFSQASMIAVFFLVFICQQYLVKGPSMEPTLHEGDRLLVEKVSYLFSKPKRGDIVVIKHEYPKRIIKRIVGLPGEIIYAQNGHLFVNGEEYAEEYIKESFQDFNLTTVKEGTYFVLGDNRNNSNDSRFFESVKKEDIIGRAFLRLLPLKKFGLFVNPEYKPIGQENPSSPYDERYGYAGYSHYYK